MDKYTVIDAAEILGVSKEAVYNRIRRNTLNSVTENGIKYVILDKKQTEQTPTKKTHQAVKNKTNSHNDKYIQFLLEQIDELKKQVIKLEDDKEKLIGEKEKLLIDSKEEIERIFSQRDKQLKQIVSLVSQPLLTYMQNQNETIDADFEELTPYERGLVFSDENSKWIKLEDYMEKKGYSDKKKKSINEQILAKLGESKHIKQDNEILFIKRGKKIKQIIGKGKK